MPAAIAMVAGSVVSGAMQSSAAKKAAGAQADAANNATLEQGRQFDQYREDMAPFRQAGYNALGQINTWLGLGGGAQRLDRAQLREQLLPQFTSGGGGAGGAAPNMAGWQLLPSAGPEGGPQQWLSPQGQVVPFEQGMTGMLQAGGAMGGGGSGTIDEAGLNAAIDKKMAEQQGQGDPNNPLYGSFTKAVTQEDIRNDPVFAMSYDFGAQQGNQALERAAAASGRLGTGRFIKDATKFATDYAGTKAGEAWNRTWTGRQNAFNMVAPVAQLGQTATQQVGQAGMQFGQMAGNNLMAAGNARASGYMGQGNAMTDMIGGIYGAGKKGGWWGDTQPAPYAPYQYGGSYNPDN